VQAVLEVLAAAALGYLLGAFPTAFLLARARKQDVFELGSRNMGAMNTARHLGPALGALVLIIDVAKGALAAFAGLNMPLLSGSADAAGLSSATLVPALVAGAAAILGHCYSAYIGFRGGKGLATALGAALPVYPLAGVYAVVLIVALVLIFRRSDPATLITLFLYPLITLLTLERQGWPRDLTFLVTTGVIVNCLIGLVKHVQVYRASRRAHCHR